MYKIRFLAPIVATLLLAGCASNPSPRDEAIIDLATTYAVAKYKEKRPESGANIVKVASAVKALIAGDATATLPTLQEFVEGEIAKLNLSPADHALANGLVAILSAELQARVDDGLIPADQKVRVAHLLDVVIAAAGA